MTGNFDINKELLDAMRIIARQEIERCNRDITKTARVINVNNDKTVKIEMDGKQYDNIPNYNGTTLSVNNIVKVTYPQGQASNMYVSGGGEDEIYSNFTTDYLALNTLFSQPISETDVCYVMRYGHIVFLKLTVKFAQALAGTTTWLILPEQFRPKYYVKAPATLFKNGLPTGDTVSIFVNGEIKTDSGADSGAWNFVYTSYYVE